MAGKKLNQSEATELTKTQLLSLVTLIQIFKMNANSFLSIKNLIAVGFEPTPFQTGALNQRLRPLGHATLFE